MGLVFRVQGVYDVRASPLYKTYVSGGWGVDESRGSGP